MAQKNKFFFFLLIIVLAQNTKTFAQYNPNYWQLEDTTGIPGRYFGASFTIGSIIYVGTGITGSSYSSDFWAYNTLTNTWHQLTNFPGAGRANGVGFSINGVGYMGFGNNGSTQDSDFYKFTPGATWTTGTWSNTVAPISPTPGGTCNAVAFTLNDSGYVCTGANLAGTSVYNYLYRYDPIHNQWASKTVYPSNRCDAVAFVINDIAYVGTGLDAGSTRYSDFYAYYPTTDSWSPAGYIPSLPESGINAGVAFSICDYGYVGLGPNNHFYQYNAATNLWDSSAMSPYIGTSYIGDIAAGINVAGDTAYGFVGFGSIAAHINDFYKYSPPVHCITPTTSVNNTKANDELEIFPNPATSELTITSKNKIANICITNLVGQTIYNQSYNSSQAQINIKDLPSGTYLVKVNNTEVRKFVKE